MRTIWWSRPRSSSCRWRFGYWWYAILFGVLNLALLAWRVRSEEAALKPLREPPRSETGDAQPPEPVDAP